MFILLCLSALLGGSVTVLAVWPYYGLAIAILMAPFGASLLSFCTMGMTALFVPAQPYDEEDDNFGLSTRIAELKRQVELAKDANTVRPASRSSRKVA
jgi:hypothetical protein